LVVVKYSGTPRSVSYTGTMSTTQDGGFTYHLLSTSGNFTA
jgi:hypothetical protein